MKPITKIDTSEMAGLELAVTDIINELLADSGYDEGFIGIDIVNGNNTGAIFSLDDGAVNSGTDLPRLGYFKVFPSDFPFNVDFLLQDKTNIEPYEATIICKADWVNTL